MATTWADIQRLAADLQRVQLAEGTKRLSEANCVELVTMLMAMEKVQLVITSDGKEFVTRRHLVTECANECLASGGRIALTDLAAQLNVDLDHIQTAVNQLLTMNQHHRMAEDENAIEGISAAAEFVVCAGELVHRGFINDLCDRLNTRLTELGQMSLFQLTKQWELTTELFNFHILPEIGHHSSARICAIRFEDFLCTPRYIDALRRKMSAILVALTKPTLLSSIHSYFGISQTLFFKLWNDLADEGKLPGHLLGAKTSLNSLYVPKVHEKMTAQYIKQRISMNHFIECAVLKRLNVVPSDPLAFFREFLPENEFSDLLFWPSVVLSESKLCQEFESLAQNLLQTNHFCSIDEFLPPQFSFLTDGDYAKIIERLQKHGTVTNLRATGDHSIIFEHPKLLDDWLKSVEQFIRERATKDAPQLRKTHLETLLEAKKAEKHQKQQPKDEWDADKPTSGKKGKGAGAKKGGGATAAKRRGAGGTETEAQAKNDPLSTAKLPTDEVFSELSRTIASNDSLPLESLRAELEEEFESAVNKLYRKCIAEECKKVEMDEQQGQRKIYEQKMSKISELYTDICLYEKGTEMFGGYESLSVDLRAFLLRSLCTELAQSLLHALADPFSLQPPQQQNFSHKFREQLIANLESKETQKLAKELLDNSDSLEYFHDTIQRFADCAGTKLRRPDKKERSDRQHKIEAELRAQLAVCSDAPTLLLLAVLLTLKTFFGVTVHASGKFVQPLIIFISSSTNGTAGPSLPSELKEMLTDTQRLVVSSIRKRRSKESGGGGRGAEEDEAEKQLTIKMQSLREFFGRSMTAAAEEEAKEEETMARQRSE